MIPQPVSFTAQAGSFRLGPSTTISAPAEIGALIRELLCPVTGLDLPSHTNPTDDLIEMTCLDDSDLGAEGYRLSVTPQGVWAAASMAGLRWAVQTLRQLLPPQGYASGAVNGIEWTLPYCEITDRPVYPWRGLLVDVGRWYQPISWLKKVVDLLAMHRMNILHLHLTEDSGWRFEVKRYPRLTEIGSWRRESPAGHNDAGAGDGIPHGGFYTQTELRELVGYAQRRGVTIVPEIDVPGHALAAIASYPGLGSNPGTQHEVATRWGIETRVLNCEQSTVDFMRRVLDEVLDVFPSPFIHLGGDEVPVGEWQNAGVSNPEHRVSWWIGQLAQHLQKRGRRAVAWDLGQQAPEGVTLMAWRGHQEVAAALTAGHDVIATPESHLYLDYNESHDDGEPLSIGFGPTPLAKTYGYQPGEEAGILGLQGSLWSEYLPEPQRAEYNLLPRLCAIAEIGWGTTTNEANFRHRLGTHLSRLDACEVNYRNPSASRSQQTHAT